MASRRQGPPSTIEDRPQQIEDRRQPANSLDFVEYLVVLVKSSTSTTAVQLFVLQLLLQL